MASCSFSSLLALRTTEKFVEGASSGVSRVPSASEYIWAFVTQ